MMDNRTDDEPAVTVFTQGDLDKYNPDNDSEFDALDNSLDCVPDNFRKPIPEGMAIEELVEAMEENEDTVECTECGCVSEKSACVHNKEGFGWRCANCATTDTLVEDAQEEYDLATLVKDSINHLVNDLGKDSQAEDFADDVIGDLERNYSNVAPEDFDRYQDWCSAVACEVSRQLNRSEGLTEAFDPRKQVELEYKDMTATITTKVIPATRWDPEEYEEEDVTKDFTYKVDAEDVAKAIWEEFISEDDVTGVYGGLDALEDEDAWLEYLNANFDKLVDKYYGGLLDYFRDAAEEAAEEEFQDDFARTHDDNPDPDRAYDEWRDSQYFDVSKNI